MKIYTTLAALFWFMRQFVFPNPFEVLGEGIAITIRNDVLILSPELLNWFADPIIYVITFGVVGLYYIRGSAPALGSILYMIFYTIHICLIYWVLSFYPTIWVMILIIIVYVVLHVSALIYRISK